MGKPKRWEIGFSRETASEEIDAIATALGMRGLSAALLYHRGCRTPEEARRFLRLEDTLLHDPFLLCDMDKAASRLHRAIISGERICIWGDYDADGVTATSVLYLYLKKRGANVDYFIPDRIRDGYGMNDRAVRERADEGTELIVTVDNGITALAPIALAYELGMEVIVTDHHEPHGALPQACAVVNPHRVDDSYPFKELAGVGVAFKLVCAAELLLAAEQGRQIDYRNDLCRPYLDLVAIGTVADVMALTGENRLIVSLGLSVLSQTDRPGLRALIEQSMGQNRRMSASSVSFTLAPRINAAGRLGSAMRAVELLLTESEFEADRLAAELCQTNRERQNEENGIFLSAQERIARLHAEDDTVLVLDCDDWHPGVTGIVSSRVTERYGRPSFLITYDGNVGKGSGRSVPGISLMDLLAGCEDLLIQYGGHEMAAGLTVERDKVPLLRARMNERAAVLCPGGIPETVLLADCEITLSDVTERQIKELGYLEPCGTGNPQPVFVLRDAELCETVGVGSNRHTRLQLRGEEKTITAMYFGVSPDRLDYRVGDRVDLLVQMDLNEFGGHVTPQLLVRDMDHAHAEREAQEACEAAFDAYIAGAREQIPLCALPERPDFARAYRTVRQLAASGGYETTLRSLARAIFGSGAQEGADAVNRLKLGLILRVFAQTDLLRMEPLEHGIADTGTQRGMRLRIRLPEQEKKVDLTASPLFCRLHSLECAQSLECVKGDHG